MIVGQPTVTLKLLKILKLLQKLLKHTMARLALVGLLSLATDTLAVSLLGAGEGPGSCPAAPFRGQIMGFHPSNILALAQCPLHDRLKIPILKHLHA